VAFQSFRRGDGARQAEDEAGEIRYAIVLRQWRKKKDSHDAKELAAAQPKAPELKRVRTIPQFVEPQLCRLVKDPPKGRNWVHEVKLDGYRMQLRVADGKVTVRTRKGLDWTDRFPTIAADGRHLPDCMIEGEACALGENAVPAFESLQAALSENRPEELIYYAFDLLFLEGMDFRDQPLGVRKEKLQSLIGKTRRLKHTVYVEHFAVQGARMLETACEARLEGIISKRIDAPYRSGRGELWTKAKCRGGQEVVIGGWWGDRENLRSIQVGMFRDGKLAYAGSVGTGFNARNVGPLLKALRPLGRATSPFEVGEKPPRSKEINFVEPKLVAEVEYASITSGGLLRQASFKGLREDKPAKSVVPEKPKSAEEAEAMAEKEKRAAKSSERPAKPVRMPPRGNDPVVAGVTITNANKELWPASKLGPAVTKLDLARYYEEAAERILPHIILRPVSLVRAPDGITGQRFFQRHVLAGVPAVAMKVKGEPKAYHAVDSVKGLVAFAQAGVVEFHPWGCKKGDVEVPERLIFDLDPDEELSFPAVLNGANEMRDRLADLGFTPFIKTTGGKGLHVVVAIKGSAKKQPNWPEAKAFAKAVCDWMAADAPERYTTNMSKKQRGGRIFLDYLRNDRTSTAVGLWSPRGREGATIATSLKWSEVKTGLDPKAFRMETKAKVLKRADPWDELMKTAYSLEAAAKKLGR
jgi:bifunctional non-homologous end joining protein LigD